jgi:hypothetical protein
MSRMRQLKGSAIVDSSKCVQDIVNTAVRARGKSSAWLLMPRTVLPAAVAGRTSVPGPVKEAYRVRGMQLYVPEMGDVVQFSEPLEHIFGGNVRALAFALQLRSIVEVPMLHDANVNGGAGVAASGSGAGASGSGAGAAGSGAGASGSGVGGGNTCATALRKRRIDFDAATLIARWQDGESMDTL